VKLLFDQNLSHRLVEALSDLFPESAHLRDIGLSYADDDAVWHHAKVQSYTIVSKDSDFHQRSFLYGFPPKVVWIRTGNCSTNRMIQILRDHADDLQRLKEDGEAAFLEIG